jgi:hypothetical protein
MNWLPADHSAVSAQPKNLDFSNATTLQIDCHHGRTAASKVATLARRNSIVRGGH